MNEKNDWIIASINNPSFTPEDFRDVAGFTLDNTLLLPKEAYYRSNKVTENPAFQKSDGTFDKEKFDNFYAYLSYNFGKFSADDLDENYEYGFWDVLQKPDSKVHNPNFLIIKVPNPTHLSIGVVSPNMEGERTKTDLELAEKLNIFNWTSGKFEDETPESSALFTNPFKFIKNAFVQEPLVLAKYEEDTDEIDPLTGMMRHHRKGENKINSNGEYYFETLGGRSIVGKEVLSLGDIITKEDTAVNDYDFFDSDDLDKSYTGTIVKNLVYLAPAVFSGPVGASIYSGMFVVRELAKTLPMLYGIGTILSDCPETPSMLNTIAGYGKKFTGGTSEYSKSHTFSFENFGNLISDVALQWGLLQLIANGILKIKRRGKTIQDVMKAKGLSDYERQATRLINDSYAGKISSAEAFSLTGASTIKDILEVINTGKWTETVVGAKAMLLHANEVMSEWTKLQKAGLVLSLAYMAMISNPDVYEQALQKGASRKEAAMVALGSTVGMFIVDKYLGLGEMFFDDELAAQRRLYRKTLSDHVTSDVKPFLKLYASEAQETLLKSNKHLLNLFSRAKNSSVETSSNFISKYREQIKDRSLGILGKSIGEGLEEFSEELVTDFNRSLYELAALFGYTQTDNIGAWDNAFERYTMSFLGGAIGGGIYGVTNQIKNPRTVSDLNSRDLLLLLVRENKVLDILKELKNMRDKGYLAPKNLSMNTTKDSNGNTVYLTAQSEEDSQNEFVYKKMRAAILQMDEIINGNQLNLTDDLLFDRMIMSDFKLSSLKLYLGDASYLSGLFLDFLKIVNKIYEIDKEIHDLNDTSTDSEKRKSENYDEKLSNLQKLKAELEKEKDDFLKNKSLRYLQKTIFILDPEVSGLYLPLTQKQFVQLYLHKRFEDLTESESEEIDKMYKSYVKSFKMQDVDEAFEEFIKMGKRINPAILDLKKEDVEKWSQVSKEFREMLPNFYPNYDEILKPENIDVPKLLEDLGILKSDEYDKPWKSDPTKSNKAFRLSLEEKPSEAFEIVKDQEDGFWSIHFKTSGPKVLSDNLKERLFKAAAAIIPEGDKLSTLGILTKGGQHGISRFRNLGFRQNGVRNVKLSEETESTFNPSEVPSLEEILDLKTITKEYNILSDKNGNITPTKVKYSYTNEGKLVINFFDSPFFINKDNVSDDNYQSVDENWNKENLSNTGKIVRIEYDGSKWHTFVEFKNTKLSGSTVIELEELLTPELVPQNFRENVESKLILLNTYKLEDIEIPIWEKSTGETEEEFKNRNTQLENETPELFSERVLERNRRVVLLHQEQIFKALKKMGETVGLIDANTYRYILSTVRLRSKDVIKYLSKGFGDYGTSKDSLYSQFQESLDLLNVDLSNKDDIWKSIESKLREELRAKHQEFLNRNNLFESSFPVELLKVEENKTILLKNLDVLGIARMETDPSAKVDRLLEIQNNLNELFPLDIYGGDFSEFLVKYSDFLIVNSIINGEIEIPIGGSVPLNRKYNLTGDENIEPTNKISSIEDAIILNQKLNDEFNNTFSVNEEGDLVVAVSSDFFDEDNKSRIDPLKDDFDRLIKRIQSNDIINSLESLKSKIIFENNPTIKVIRAIASKLGEDFGDIESTLQTIYEQFDVVSDLSDFLLTDSLIKALEKAQLFIQIAKAYINAATEEDSITRPFVYNKTINEWVLNHKGELDEDIELLPEIDVNISNVIRQDLVMYQKEINSWIEAGKANVINKQRMFKMFDSLYENVKLKFFTINRDKWLLEDGTNLLDGVELKEDPKDLVLEYERALYRNSLAALSRGYTIKDLFKSFEKTINWNIAKTQKTSRLDNNLEELSDYDKFVYIITSMCYNPDNFYKDYKEFVKENLTKLAPLSFLKMAIRIIKALQNNLSFINEMLYLFRDKVDLSKIPVLDNVTVVTGIGGAGKTSVCAKAGATGKVWVSGPTDTQITNLKGLKDEDIESFTREELLKSILGDLYKDFIEDKLSSSFKFNDVKVVSLNDNINILKLDTVPKVLIIDEITLYSNKEILLISKWANRNDVHVILLGDEYLNSDVSDGWNIDRETNFALRVPKMGLSLREANLWKYLNLDTLSNFELKLLDTDTFEESKNVANLLLQNFHDFYLKYYFLDGTLTGDMIVDSKLTQELINSLTGPVKFIGSKDSSVYKQLQDARKVNKAYSLKEIQGQESEYIVCDINWSLPNSPSNLQVLLFMRTLYTVITRSSKGSIIINNGLNNIIGGSKPQSYTTNSIMINSEAIENFSENELKWLESLNLVVEDNKKEKEKTQEPVDLEKESSMADPKPGNILAPIDPGDDSPKEEVLPDKIEVERLPIHSYTSFNFLGVHRGDKDNDYGWSNPENSRRDVGIFINSDEGIIKDQEAKEEKRSAYLDLKSCFTNGNLNDLTRYDSISNLFDVKDLEDAEYYIVKEDPNEEIHHLIYPELGLLTPSLPFYSIQARFKNKKGELCTLTIGVLPTVDNIHKEFIENDLKRKIESKKKNDEDSKVEETLLKNLNKEISDYKEFLDRLKSPSEATEDSITEFRINKPLFPGRMSVTDVRSFNEEKGEWLKHKIRLSSLDPKKKSRYFVRNGAYVTSPIYTDVVAGKPMSGKPYMLVSNCRYLTPSQLIDVFKSSPNERKVALIPLISAGVSFESFFENVREYQQGDYTLPFESGPMGVRMYVALHNFRLRLKEFNELVKLFVEDEFKGKMEDLESLLKKESEAYVKWKEYKEEYEKDSSKTGKPEGFEPWAKANYSENFQIIWDFNKNKLQNIKLFRLGYNQVSGVYNRSISDKIVGNYINPKVAILYYDYVDKIFINILDKIINPKELLSKLLLDKYLDYSTEDWARNFTKNTLKIVTQEVYFSVEGESLIHTIKLNAGNNVTSFMIVPIILSKIVKNSEYYLNRAINGKSLSIFDTYTLEKDNKYSVAIDDNFIPYLSFVDDLKNSSDLIGVYENTEEGVVVDGKHDRRLINLFNIAFHGSIFQKVKNDFTKNDFRATEVMFGLGFFVDPILGGVVNKNKDYRIIATDSKFYLTRIAPSSPKAYFTISPYEKTKQVEDKNKEKPEEKNKEVNLLQTVIKKLKEMNINISFGRIKNMTLDDINKHFIEKLVTKTTLKEFLKHPYEVVKSGEEYIVKTVEQILDIDFSKIDMNRSKYSNDSKLFNIVFTNGETGIIKIENDGKLVLSKGESVEGVDGSEGESNFKKTNFDIILELGGNIELPDTRKRGFNRNIEEINKAINTSLLITALKKANVDENSIDLIIGYFEKEKIFTC